jgi:thioredoxin 1
MAAVVKIILGVVLGGGAGYFASRLLCIGGGCPITSNRPLMVAMGAFFGVWLMVAGCRRGAAEEVRFGTELNSAEEFQAKVVGSDRPALVDFHATWCGPCRALAPILAKLEQEYAGRVDFYRVDTDRLSKLAAQHDVQYLPTLVLYRGGQPVDRTQGLKREEELRRHLDQLLSTE